MQGRFTDLAPANLGRVAGPDPFSLQPGAILFDRFCAIGGVRHNSVGWRAPVTDLQRQLGSAPHHRLDLVFLPVAPSAARRIRLSLPSYQVSCRRIHATFEAPEGLILLTQPTTSGPPHIPLPQRASGLVGRTLGRILANLHGQGLVGARFEGRSLRIDPDDRCQLSEWGHLLNLRHGESEDEVIPDIEALLRLLERLGVASELLTPSPTSAAELARRFDAELSDGSIHAADALPAIPPFVARRSEIRAAHQQMSEARFDGPSLLVFQGPKGSGKSRLLEQLELEFRRGNGVVCVRVHPLTAQLGSQGLTDVMTAIASEVQTLHDDDRDAISARMKHRTGPLSSIVEFFDTRLGAMVDRGPQLPALPLDKQFVRHAAVAAHTAAAIGTHSRPLVLMVDDVDNVDVATRALLYHLLEPNAAHHTAVILTSTGPPPPLPRDPTTVQLDPFDLKEMESFVSATLPGAIEDRNNVAAILHELSKGNPQQAWDGLQVAVQQERLVARPAWRWSQPATTGRVLQLSSPISWDRLSVDSMRVAAIVALRPELAGIPWLKRVTQWPMPRIEAATGELVANRLLRWSDASLQWTSDAVRADVVEAAGADAIQKAHAAVLQWLASLGDEATPAQTAWHSEHATPAGPDATVAQQHLLAGTALLRAYDAERAQWHFERALDRAADGQPRGGALEGRADALLLQDRIDEALQSYVQAIDLAARPEEALGIAIKAMHGMYLHGASSAAVAVADRALRRLGQRLPRSSIEGAFQALRSWFEYRWGPRNDAQSDLVCQLHWLHVGAVFTTHPSMVLSSLMRGIAAARNRSSGATALARANLSIMLAGLGARGPMNRMLACAQSDADEANDVFAKGVVYAARGTNLLGLGEYSDGQLYVQKAIGAFRAAGDLSVGVTTMALGVFYAIDREPATELLDAIRAAESAAFRQRNKSVLPGILGMKLWVRTRLGELSAAEVESQARRLEVGVNDGDLVGAVVGDSFAALALHRVNRLISADARARRALDRLDKASIRPPFLSIALLAAARVAVGRVNYLGGTSRARVLLRRLRKRSRTVRSIAVATDLTEASLQLVMGDVPGARATLAQVIGTAPSHKELWHELEAHEVLARILPGHDPVAASVHSDRVATLRQRLFPDRSEPEHPQPIETPSPAEEPDATRVDVAVNQLLPLVEPHLSGRNLIATAQHGLRAKGPTELVELLLVNLVLAAGDASAGEAEIRLSADQVDLSAEDAATLPDAVTGRWARVTVRSTGPRGQGARGALAECSDLCRRIGGFLQVGEGDQVTISAWLPSLAGAPPTSKGLIAVLVGDPRLQRTLIDGARQLGWSAQVVFPGEPLGFDAAAVFSEPHNLPEGNGRVPVFEIVERRGGWDRTSQLPVPFLLKELQELLSLVQEDQDSSATALPPA